MPTIWISFIFLFWSITLLFAQEETPSEEVTPPPLEETSTSALKVQEIIVRGNINVSDLIIRSQLETKVGQPLRQEVLNKDIRQLHRLGYFSDIRVLQEETEQGIRLIFQVRENQIIVQLLIEGNQAISDSEIKEVLKSKAGRDQFFSEFYVIIDKENILNLYQSKGYVFIEVSHKVELVEEGLRLSFFIIEGDEVSIEDITFEGNYSFSESTLSRYMVTKENGFLFTTGIYEPKTFDEDIVLLKNYYRSEGFIDVEAYLGSVAFNEAKNRIFLHIVIHEGPIYRVDEIVIQGHQLFTTDEIHSRLKVHQGDIFKQGLIGEDIKTVEKIYGENAYVDTLVQLDVTYRELGNLVKVHYTVSEKQKSYLDEIIIRGNTQTQDKVIRREISLAPGAAMNTVELEDSQRRLRNLRYFNDVTYEYQDGDSPGTKKAYFDVEEGKTGSIRFAAGISSDQGFTGSISFVKRNFDLFDIPTSWEEFLEGNAFTGAGQTLSLSFQPSQETVLFNISWEEPYLFDQNVDLGVNLFLSQSNRNSYQEDRLGTRISVGRRFGREMVLDLSLRWELVSIEDLDFLAPTDAFAVAGDNTFSSLGLRYLWDKRDDLLLPSEGFLLSTGIEWSNEFLGGDFNFLKYTFSYDYYYTLYKQQDGEKHILDIGTRLGYADPFGGTEEVPIFERFFAGGLTSVRGFEYRTLGPQEFGEPIGGEAMYIGSLEYSFPLYDQILRGALFTDIGNIAETYDDGTFDDFRASYGFGLRVRLPQILGPRPLALNFGFPIIYNHGDDLRVFSFSIGRN
jgi:outer membrane protein insertion porin family